MIVFILGQVKGGTNPPPKEKDFTMMSFRMSLQRLLLRGCKISASSNSVLTTSTTTNSSGSILMSTAVSGEAKISVPAKIGNSISKCWSAPSVLTVFFLQLRSFLMCFVRAWIQENALSPWLHMFDFTPVCILVCLLKLLAWDDA